MGNPIKRRKLRKLEALRAAMPKEIPSVLVSGGLQNGFVELKKEEEVIVETTTVQEEVKAEQKEENIVEEFKQEEKPSKKKKPLQGE